MAYIATMDFKDLQTGHEYKKGDAFPFEGVADEARIQQLAEATTQRGALIVWEVKKKSKKVEGKKEG
jgi:hypothetical protein